MLGGLGTLWATSHILQDLVGKAGHHYNYHPPASPHEMAVVFGLGFAVALTITGILLWTAD